MSIGTDGRTLLSKISGVPVKEIDEIWEEVKKNQKMLDSCPGPHEFAPGDASTRDQCKCLRCNATLSKPNVHWYQKGLAHNKVLLEILLPNLKHIDSEYDNDHWATGWCPRCLVEIALGLRNPKYGGKTLEENKRIETEVRDGPHDG